MPRRTSQAPEFRNFGGINTKATLVNIGSAEAQDITNFDIGLDGGITQRLGYIVYKTFITPVQHFARWLSLDGIEYFGVVANNKFYESTSPAGPWVDRTGSVSITEVSNIWQSVNWQGKLYLFNGTDKPLVADPGKNLVTLEDLSLLSAPTGISIDTVGSLADLGQRRYGFLIEACTTRGGTGCQQVAFLEYSKDIATVDETNYPIITWDAVTNAVSFKVYRSITPFDAGNFPNAPTNWALVAELTSDTFDYSYTNDSYEITKNPSISNLAFNTPADWNANGQPVGGIIVARGRDERMMVWRKNLIWACALSNPLDWFSPANAFAFTINGGIDNNVQSVGALYEYTCFFTKTNSFLYSGASSDTIQIVKILDVGCISPLSLVLANGDLYFWSWYGPMSFQRVMAGQDVQISPMNYNVQPIIQALDKAYWGQITGYFDALQSRIVWAYPSTGTIGNDKCLVYQIDVQAWTKYDSWHIVNCARNSDGNIYATMADGSLVHLHSGNNDGGAGISATYKSCWFDLRAWDSKKRMTFIDIVMDSTADYTVSFKYDWDYGAGPTETQTLNYTSGSAATTNGTTVDQTQLSQNINIHRVFTYGIGRSFQLTFTNTTDNRRAKILGWRPEVFLLGGRN